MNKLPKFVSIFETMLQQLLVQNYVLIEKIEIEFSEGLSIITGETGAGKSILLGALSLIAGNRADVSALQDKTKKCIVEGTFIFKDDALKVFFNSNELDYSRKTIIRREISFEGKSRAFINDTPVNLSLLKELVLNLIDVHSQHETLTLNESAYQLAVLDAYAKVLEQVTTYKQQYADLKEKEQKLAKLIEKESYSRRDTDYWQFQYDELVQAELKPGEQDEIENDLKILNHSEEIKSVFSKCLELLNGGEVNMLSGLSGLKSFISGIASLNPAYIELQSRIDSTLIELKDIALEIESAEEKILSDPKQAELYTQRIDLLYRLQKKHKVDSVEGLIEVLQQAENRLREVSSLTEEINTVRLEINKMREKLFSQAKVISTSRKKALPKIESEVSRLLSLLAMPQAHFHIEQSLQETLTPLGIDRIRFLFSANKGGELKEISKSASGGELSRLMLCIKYLIAKNTSLPTIIFDEIDTGVSGSVAEQVGKLIHEMGTSMQVVVITHLPQIASKGNNHYTVYKEEIRQKTQTNIKHLSEEERITEIAKMLSAGKPTEASLKNAKELLKV